MPEYTIEELAEALIAIHSIIHKCEKAQAKFPEGNSHHTLLQNRLKAMYISNTLITETLSKKSKLAADNENSANLILLNLELLHTTDLGYDRIKRNLMLDVEDVTLWCKEKIKSPNSKITRNGKNWYIMVDSCEITVNAHSYTIITAHRRK